MKVERNTGEVQLPPVGRISSVAWADGFMFKLANVEPEYIFRQRKQEIGRLGFAVRGRPIMWAFNPHNSMVLLYPIPDTAGNMIVRYFPPEVEI
jgi:hypothetical protein